MKHDYEDEIRVIRDVLKILKDPDHWIKGSVAKTAEGYTCSSLDPEAICFCSIGALNLASATIGRNVGMNSTMRLVEAELASAITYMPANIPVVNRAVIVKFNDSSITEHKDVLRVFNMTLDILIKKAAAGNV